MIPGLSGDAESRLIAVLDSRVTELREDSLAGCDFTLLAADEPEARELGVECGDGPPPTLVVTDVSRPVGRVHVRSQGRNNLLFFDNRRAEGGFHANIRVLGSESVLFFNDIGDGYAALPDVLLRSNEQFLFWGTQATAVGCSVEIEGNGCGVVIGDDALISSGVWIRNHDMHTIHDLRTREVVNRAPANTILERHVWLGQDALLLNCERVGAGAIVGARALLKQRTPACVIVAGTPARIIREHVSWGRSSYRMTDAEHASVMAAASGG
jgi:acetyltransferase-like isoleucine patch superfamily enzyme